MTKCDFDICDGRNEYKPCPCCSRKLGMGLVSNKVGWVWVVCTRCWFAGPDFKRDMNDLMLADKQAFDSWNALAR